MRRNISLQHASVLLTNVALARKNKDIGFEDADRTYTELIEALSQGRAIQVKQEVLESALWACNLLDEKIVTHKCSKCGNKEEVDTEFYHPLNKSFDFFVRCLINLDEKFNKELNYIEKATA